MRLRTELRDWMRLPLNRAIVALKKSANLSSVSDIIDMVPALGGANSDGKGESQNEIAELEKRLKAYNSMVKAKNGIKDDTSSENSQDSLTYLLPPSLAGSEEKKDSEVEEGEVVSADDEKRSEKKVVKKKKHREKSPKRKSKKHKKEDADTDNLNEESLVRNVGNSAQSRGPGGEWIGLLRKHVGGAWPSKKSSSDSQQLSQSDISSERTERERKKKTSGKVDEPVTKRHRHDSGEKRAKRDENSRSRQRTSSRHNDRSAKRSVTPENHSSRRHPLGRDKELNVDLRRRSRSRSRSKRKVSGSTSHHSRHDNRR